MAIVDSLLKLIDARGADALVFVPGEPPALETKGELRSLSMPDPGPEFVEAIVEETLDEAARARLAAGQSVSATHVADGVTYRVRVDPRGDGSRLAFRRPGAPDEALEAEGAPVAVAVPSSPAPRPASASARAMPVPPSPEPVSTVPPGALVDHEVRVSAGPLAGVLQRASQALASDILVSSGRTPRLRVGGQIQEAGAPPLDDAAILAFLGPALGAREQAELERSGSVDLALEVAHGSMVERFRANLFRQHGGLGLAMRPIRRDPPTLSRLNLPPELVTLAHHRNGLVLVTGTTGSGKSTTLVALIEHLNQTTTKHILTLEDPIEYEYTPRNSLIHQRQVGVHVDGFASGLRSALRESPDVILLGEMRDHATISAALTAAETGHLVLSTLHTGSAAMAIDRMIDVFPQHQQAQIRFQLSTVLRAVLTQRLVASDRGLVPIVELLRVNTAVAAKIREGRGHQLQTEIQKGRSEGMISFETSLADLVRAGRLGREAALEHADDPGLLRSHLGGRA